MKNSIPLSLAIALSCTIIINCSLPNDGIAFEIVETDNGKTFQAEMNDEFTIALYECVGCAYEWTITKQDPGNISLEEKTSRDRSCTNCKGGSLMRVFRFKCLQRGQSDLELAYFEDTLSVTIDVQ